MNGTSGYDLRSRKAIDQAIKQTNRNLHRTFLAFRQAKRGLP
jgi:hypothetical protein